MPEIIVGPVALAFTNLLELEEMARAKVPRATFDYIAGGAEDEGSLRRDRREVGRGGLRPRGPVDVSKRGMRTGLLAERESMPVCVAPPPFHASVRPPAEIPPA